MKIYRQTERFPLGAVAPEGFLKEQMIRSKNGIGGHLFELEPGMIRDPYTNKTYVEAWGNGDQSGWGAEISGNYWTGYIQHAFTLHDPDMIRTATDWVDTMIAKQRPDGYLGTYYEPDAKIHEDYNAWGTACAMRGLIAFYEATGRRDVFEAVYRNMLWFCENWSGDNKTSYAGIYIVEPMVFVWYETGDERLIDFCLDYFRYVDEHDIFGKSLKSMEAPFRYNSDHTAGAGCSVRLPALVYSATGDKRYLQASETMIRKIREHSVQLSGGPVSMVEYFGPVAATSETEYCSFAFYNQSYSCLSFVTGDAKYGDYMEEMFYNGTQGARRKDEKAIAYLSAPNQFYATTESSTSGPAKDMQAYAPCYPVSCCPVNAVTVLPEFVRGMFLHSGSDIYTCAYGPVSLDFGGIHLLEKTMYPFRRTVAFEASGEKDFSLHLKIPAWAKGYAVTLNGSPVSPGEPLNGYLPGIAMRPGDCAEIRFKAEIEVIRVHDEDMGNKRPLAVKYGPLLFSYHVPELWTAVPGRPMTPLPDGWSWYNVTPVNPSPGCKDPHDNIGMQRFVRPWHIAMDENLTAADFTVDERDGTGYVWEDAPIRLHTHCYRAPWVCATYPRRTFEPFGQKQAVTERLPLELVPYGCTNLRLTYFPIADLPIR